ncbi:MAG TPA: sugar transferase [Candidatus Binataceae bacterium]|nr:sugar transferase [Candidatus Binataceae bacterium]
MNRERPLFYHLLLLADVVTLGAAFLFTYWATPVFARNALGLSPFDLGTLDKYLWLLVVIVPAWVAVLNLDGDLTLLDASPLGIAWHVVKTGLMSTALVALFLYATKNPLSRILIISEGFFSTCFLMLERATILWIIRYRRRRGWDRRSVLVVGTDEQAVSATRAIRNDPLQRMEVHGFLSHKPHTSSFEGVPVLGTLADYRHLIWKSPIEEVLISPEVAGGPEANEIIRYCDLIGLTVRLIPNYAIADAQLWSRLRIDSFLGQPALTIAAGPSLDGQLLIKRVLDLAVSGLLLILLSPFFLVIAIAVKLSSPGPIFYRWRVVGKGIRPFTGYKFRSMVADADARKAELAKYNEMSGPVFKIKDDPRITSIGRFLRKYSLDELPQLWSVFKGDMSLVGPRPPGPHEFAAFEIWHRRKLCVKPGITCLWQVGGRNRVSHFDDWVTLDLEYIDNWSLWLDLKILARTALAVVRGTGA